MTKQNSRKPIYLYLSILLALLLIVSAFISLPDYARASTDYIDFDDSNVLDDLESSEDFNLNSFPFNKNGKAKVINFVEWAYSSTDKDDFGLYVYFYNPRNLDIQEDSALNVIQIATKYSDDVITKASSAKRYEQFNLLFCNKSEREGYEGLFYKFRVIDKQKTTEETVLGDRAYASARRYDISGITLNTSNGVKEYAVSTTYYFEGYAAGYGPDVTADSTLTGYAETLETLSLDVHSAFYRPEGFSTDKYTQDTLHSVYFAVPDSYTNKYGEMVAVHATWINAVLKPMLVTGNQDAYNAIKPYLGKVLTSSDNLNLDYRYVGYYGEGLQAPSLLPGIIGDIADFINSFKDNHYYTGPYYNVPSMANDSDYISALYLMFNSGSATDSADSYSVSNDSLILAMQNYSKDKTKNVNETYSSNLFSSVSDRIDVNLTNDKNFKDGVYTEYSLTDKKISENSRFIEEYETTTYDNIQCIEAVTEITGNQATDCAKYYLDSSCYSDFISFYNKNKSDSTVYIFRYMTSEYWAHEAVLLKGDEDDLDAIDSNAYFFKETVSVGFNIIDVTFKNNDNYYVIPVVSDPMDIVFSSSAPIYTESDKNSFMDWLNGIGIGGSSGSDSSGSKVNSFLSKIGAWGVLIGGSLLGLILVSIWLKVFVSKIGSGGNTLVKIILIILTVAALAGIVFYGKWIYDVIISLGGL